MFSLWSVHAFSYCLKAIWIVIFTLNQELLLNDILMGFLIGKRCFAIFCTVCIHLQRLCCPEYNILNTHYFNKQKSSRSVCTRFTISYLVCVLFHLETLLKIAGDISRDIAFWINVIRRVDVIYSWYINLHIDGDTAMNYWEAWRFHWFHWPHYRCSSSWDITDNFMIYFVTDKA